MEQVQKRSTQMKETQKEVELERTEAVIKNLQKREGHLLRRLEEEGDNPDVSKELETTRASIRRLQDRGVPAMEQAFADNRHLRSGSGFELLESARSALSRRPKRP